MTFIQQRPKVSSQEIGQAITFIRQTAKNENIEGMTLNAEQVKQVIHFITGISEHVYIQKLLPQDALTLLRLTPALLQAKSSASIHAIIYHAAPIIKKANQETPNPIYRSALETAGKVCFSRRLASTTNEQRADEFTLFKDIVGNTENYQAAFNKFGKRNHMKTLSDMQIFAEAARAYQFLDGRHIRTAGYER